MSTAPDASSAYLQGNYAPIATEIDARDLPVVGHVPADLAGTFVRNGSNPRFAPRGRYHWFDGDGMLHAVELVDGRAHYRNRWIRTRAFLDEEQAGHALWTGVTERPDFTNPRGPFKDTANTDVVFHGGRLLALWWLGGAPYVVDLPSLATRGVARFGTERTLSAHPKIDAVTGEMMVFDYKPFPPYLSYGVVGADSVLRHWTTIDLPGPRLQHDLAITEHYTLVMDMSLRWDPALLARGQTKVTFFRDQPTRLGVLPRHGDGSTVRWFDVAPCFMYHTINAWEEGATIVLVGCRTDDPLAHDPRNPPRAYDVPTIGFLRLEPHLHRWRLHLETGAVVEEKLDDELTEFPRMDNRLLGRPSRFSYNPRLARAPTLLFDGVVRYDLVTGGSRVHAYPRGWFGGEVVFAPRAGSTRDDDGYLLTFVVEEASGASELWILDARHVEDEPVARVRIPQRVPTGYHAWWVGAS